MPTTLSIETVDHDSEGKKIIGKTIRMRIDDGDWYYGAEMVIGTLIRRAKDFGCDEFTWSKCDDLTSNAKSTWTHGSFVAQPTEYHGRTVNV